MFEASLLDGRSRGRGCATLLSFALEALGIALLLLVPLLRTQALPRMPALGTLLAPPRQASAPLPPTAAREPAPVSELEDGRLRTPARIPSAVVMLADESPPPSGEAGIAIPGSLPGAGAAGPLLTSILKPPPPVSRAVAPPKVLRLSTGVVTGLLISQVKPAYPPLAIGARIQGPVVLQAVIDRQGRVKDLQVVSGHPMLAAAALAAVKQWRYRPYYLNDEPVEVETQITVNFTLSDGR